MAIKKLNIEIENCYGIKNFSKEFALSLNNLEYRNQRSILIYAPNGTMKTSLAKGFKDYNKGRYSKRYNYR